MATSQDFFDWICGPDLDPLFLVYLLIASRSLIKSIASGATHKTIYLPTAKTLHVCIPSISKQQHIAAAIDESVASADRVRALITEQLHLAHALPHSYLRAVLGEIDVRQAPLKKLGNEAEVAAGITLGRKISPAKETRRIPYLRVANVKDGFLDLSDVKQVEATSDEILELKLKPGDILLTEGGDPDKLAWIPM